MFDTIATRNIESTHTYLISIEGSAGEVPSKVSPANYSVNGLNTSNLPPPSPSTTATSKPIDKQIIKQIH